MLKNWRNWNWYLIFVLVIVLVNVFSAGSKKDNSDKLGKITFSEFIQDVKDNKIESVTIKGDGFVEGKFKSVKDKDGNVVVAEKPFNAEVIIYNKLLETLEEYKVPTKVEMVPSSSGFSFMKIIDVLGSLLWIVVLIFLFRSLKGGDKFGIGKTNVKMFTPDMQSVRFSDVLGVDEAKQDVSEIVDFLRDPNKYSRLGAKIPKGVLLIGPPGTGKTLLAKAIAGEAGVPFFSTSGSEFVEMFVGVGASRVRALFEQATKSAPCLIFIDEIDAVGRHRGSGYGGGNDEREQTLNQLLVEMDGFASNKGVIVIAATNRVDVLDEALLRPGRFDRQVYIDLPDLKGREAILKKYMGEVKILSDVDPISVARGTPGFSGADLANLVNEAALIAARKNHKQISDDDFEYARDKILMGAEKKSKTMSPEEIKNTAYHEAGHAVCAVLLPEVDPIHKATIVPRGHSLGLVQKLPERDKVSVNITEIKSDIAVAMAGRVCEELFFGADKVTTGASSDIQMATKYARNAVIKWGLNGKIGPVFYGDKDGDEYRVSETTLREIDVEVKKMLDEGYKLAKETVVKNKAKVEKLAKALLEYETLTGDEVRAIVKGGRVSIKRKDDKKVLLLIRKASLPLTVGDGEFEVVPETGKDKVSVSAGETEKKSHKKVKEVDVEK